jgi:hypothetical protein
VTGRPVSARHRAVERRELVPGPSLQVERRDPGDADPAEPGVAGLIDEVADGRVHRRGSAEDEVAGDGRAHHGQGALVQQAPGRPSVLVEAGDETPCVAAAVEDHRPVAAGPIAGGEPRPDELRHVLPALLDRAVDRARVDASQLVHVHPPSRARP